MLRPHTPGLLVLLSIAALAACEAPRSAAPVAAARHPLVSAGAAAAEPPQAMAENSTVPAPPSALALPDLPKAIELTGKRACTWRSSRFRATVGGSGTELRLRKGGPVFARVDGGNVAITVPQGNAGGALVEAGSQGVFVSGIADAASIAFFPAKPFVMQGLVVPQGSAQLKLTAANADEVRFKLALPDEVVVAKGSLEETRPCGDIGADPSTFDSKAPVFGTRAGSHLLMSGGLAEISKRPDGTRAAMLRIPAEGDFVHTFDEQQGRTLIGWQTSSVMVFGWVRSARLQETNVSIGSMGGRGFGRRATVRRTAVASVRCEHDLPLIAEAGGEARTVGRILAGTTIRIARWGDARSPIVVDAAGIHQQHGSFSARTAELRACRDLGAPAAGTTGR
jgi:hypothetical protein